MQYFMLIVQCFPDESNMNFQETMELYFQASAALCPVEY